MALCCAVIRCQINEYHDKSSHVHVMRYLVSHVRMANTLGFEERTVSHNSRLFVASV
jgi:hypothetical protein